MRNHLLQNKCAQYRAPQIAKAKGIKIENNDLSDFAKKVARAQFAQYGI